MPALEYINRRFDVLAFRGAKARGVTEMQQNLFNANPGSTIFGAEVGGEVCTGVQKLAQRWVLEFLTIRGSMGFHLINRGSDFLAWARSGRFRTEFDVQAYFNFAAQQVRQNLINEEDATMHPEDRLALAIMNQVELFDGVLQLSVTITSQAGDNRKVILPISIVPSNISV